MRQRVSASAVVLFAVVALACGSTPTGPSASSAPGAPGSATPLAPGPTFDALLTGSNEVPAVTTGDFEGHGSATVILHVTRDNAGNATAATADFSVSLSDFPVDTVTGVHLHSGASGANGPVVLDTSVVSGEVPLASGSGGFTRTGVTVPVALAQAILSNPGAFYLQVHTALTPSGAARGQLVAQP